MRHRRPPPRCRVQPAAAILFVSLAYARAAGRLGYRARHNGRGPLTQWAVKKGDADLKHYWQGNNQLSLDQISAHIADTNGWAPE
jgi:hypothetical protein